MRTDQAEPLRQARRLDSEHKRALVLAAADAQLEAGRHPSIASIARQAGVGRKFIYDHPDLKAGIELKAAQATRSHAGDLVAAARVTGASLRAELENARAQNHRLTRQLRALENRLSKAEGAHLVADELLPDGVLTELADQQLASRVKSLTSNSSRPKRTFAAPPRNWKPPGRSTASSCNRPIAPSRDRGVELTLLRTHTSRRGRSHHDVGHRCIRRPSRRCPKQTPTTQAPSRRPAPTRPDKDC